MSVSSSTLYSGGLFALFLNGNAVISNSIIEVYGLAQSNTIKKNNGAVVGRCNGNLEFVDCYVITDGYVCSLMSHQYNTKYETINAMANKYASKAAFADAYEQNGLSFDGFGAFWNMSLEIPQI